MFRITLAIIGLSGLLAAVILAWRWLVLRSKAQQRWYEPLPPDAATADDLAAAGGLDRRGGLGRWLYRAGFRGTAAALLFLLANGSCDAASSTGNNSYPTFLKATHALPGSRGSAQAPSAL